MDDILNTLDRLGAAPGVESGREKIGSYIDACQSASSEIRRLRGLLADRIYMIDILTQLLGPKALKWWTMACQEGITRFHVSWGPEAAGLTGEERAQVLIDTEAGTAKAVD